MAVRPLRWLLRAEERPHIVDLLTADRATLDTVGAAYRSEMARALRRKGMTIDAIAELFGVTRQGISAPCASNRGAAPERDAA